MWQRIGRLHRGRNTNPTYEGRLSGLNLTRGEKVGEPLGRTGEAYLGPSVGVGERRINDHALEVGLGKSYTFGS